MQSPKQDAMVRARNLVAAGGTAALSVLDVDGGAPFTTLVNVAADDNTRPVLLISALAHHAKCLGADPRGSLMMHEQIAEGDPMLTFRVSLLGRFERLDAALSGVAEKKFLARHPYAELYVGFGDFSYWRMEPEHAHIIAGFGRAYGVRFKDLSDS
jgi:heme iron utilization protein